MNTKNSFMAAMMAIILLTGVFSFAASFVGSGHVKGDLAGFDDKDNSLILTMKKGFAVFPIDKNTVILRNNVPAGIQDLVIGEQLEVQFDSNRVAVSIKAGLGVAKGFITSIQLGGDFAEQYFVTITPEGAKPMVLRISANTVLVRDGIRVMPSQLQIGDSASATFDPKTFVVARLDARSILEAPVQVKGEIIKSAILAGPNPGPVPQVVFILQSGTVSLELKTTASTRITMDGRIGNSLDIRPGFLATVSYDPTKRVAIKIDIFTK